MNKLEIFRDSEGMYVDSRDVAEAIERKHCDLLRTIRTYCDYLTESKITLSDFFVEAEYEDSTGRILPCYFITKKGCDMIANKLTGKKGVIFTAAYVSAFEDMRMKLNIHEMKYIPGSQRSKIEMLPDNIQDEVDEMLEAGESHTKVSIMIAAATGLYVSPTSVGRYCRKYFEDE